MGGVIELVVLMLVIAIFAFAPLGYFIYMYTMKNGERSAISSRTATANRLC